MYFAYEEMPRTEYKVEYKAFPKYLTHMCSVFIKYLYLHSVKIAMDCNSFQYKLQNH